jgi:hypothetical protein
MRNLFAMSVMSLAVIGFVVVALIGVDKEAQRQSESKGYNCKHYADSINETYGREVCPPTERG